MSLLLRYGMCLSPRPTAANTSPKQDKLLLIAHASVILCPAAPLLFVRSEPAKSTRLRHPVRVWPVAACTPVMYRRNNVCEREELAFISVASTARAFIARRTKLVASYTEVTSSRTTPVTAGPPCSGRCGSCPAGPKTCRAGESPRWRSRPEEGRRRPGEVWKRYRVSGAGKI